MRKLFLIPAIALGLWSCSNETDVDNPNLGKSARNIDITEINMKVGVDDGRLVFESKSEFDQAVKALDDYNTTQIATKSRSALKTGGLIEPITVQKFTLNKYGFKSLYDEFSNAMNEAENYCDTEDGYKQFKEKYSSLFFAEQPEDYSAYLPVSNKTVAKFLNAKGEVEIAGEIKDLRDIESYQQLTDLGFTPKDSELVSTRSTVNRLSEVRCNNRKLWARAYAKPGSQGVGYWAVVDVSFRKKGFLGAWYNYSSETSLGWKNSITPPSEKSGWSSHDYYFPIAMVGKGQFEGTMWVQFRGFGKKCGDSKYEFDVNI